MHTGVAPRFFFFFFPVHIHSTTHSAMSKRSGKASASSARAASTFGNAPAFGGSFGGGSFGGSASQLSYVAEPPNLSAISDPNVVVYFRNLSKKDSTTKAKALEDLQAAVAGLEGPVEEGVLEAWVSQSCCCSRCLLSVLLSSLLLSNVAGCRVVNERAPLVTMKSSRSPCTRAPR